MPAYPYRLNRLFNPESGRALDVAVDHGFFGEHSFLTGIENMSTVIETLVEAGPDAIQLSPGQAPLLQALPGKAKPALVMRTDVANVYGNPLDTHLFSIAFPDAIEQAVHLDAVAVCVNLLQLPGRPEIREACIRAIMGLRQAATACAIATWRGWSVRSTRHRGPARAARWSDGLGRRARHRSGRHRSDAR